MDLLQGATRAEYMKKIQAAQSGLSAGIQRRKKQTVQIGYVGMNSNESSRRIYPLDFTVPFNPFDLTDDTYDADLRYVFTGSATTGYLMFRSLILENPELLKRTLLYLPSGTSPAIFNNGKNPETQGVISVEEQKLFRSWRVPKTASAPVFATQFSDRRNPLFPVMYLSDTILDNEGKIDESQTPTLSQILYQLESHCLAKRAAEVREEYTTGINRHKPEKDMRDAIKKVWSSRLISKPFFKYALRYMHIVIDPQTYTPDPKAVKSFTDNKMYEVDAMKLTGMGTLSMIQKYIGTPKDVFFDFLESEWLNPEIPKSDEKRKGQYADKVSKAQVSAGDSLFLPNGAGVTHLPDFPVAYRNYLDDPTMWNDAVTRANVRDFNTIRDEVLLSKFQSDIGVYADILADPEVAKLFIEADIDISGLTTTETLSGILDGRTAPAVLDVDKEDQQDLTALKQLEEIPADADGLDFEALMQDATPAPTTEFKSANPAPLGEGPAVPAPSGTDNDDLAALLGN